MKFTAAFAMSPPDHYVPLARTADKLLWDSIAVPDSLFYSEAVSAKYPYTSDGNRFWGPETPFLDPWIAIAAMCAGTERVRFYTNVLKLACRNPVLVAKQVSSVSVLSNNRVGLGAGLGWLPEEFEWCGADYKNRGKRGNEALEILRLILSGEDVSYDGEHFQFGTLRMCPAPSEPVPFYIGGHSRPGLRRAAKYGDGWASAMVKERDIPGYISQLDELRKKYGRDHLPFEIQVAVTDVFDVDGYRRLEDIGVTDVLIAPWMFYGSTFNDPIEKKADAMKRFSDDVISKFH